MALIKQLELRRKYEDREKKKNQVFENIDQIKKKYKYFLIFPDGPRQTNSPRKETRRT